MTGLTVTCQSSTESIVKNKIKNFKRKNYYSRSHWEKTTRVDPFVIRDKKFFNWITIEEFISTAKYLF